MTPKNLAPGERGPKPIVTFRNQVKAARFARLRSTIYVGHPLRERLDRRINATLRGES